MKSIKSLAVLSSMICGSFTLSAQCPGGGGGTTTSVTTSVTQSINSSAGGFGSYSNGMAGLSAVGISQSQSNKLVYSDLKGSPYLNEEPTKGTLVLNNGKKVDNYLLQLDLHTNQAIATLSNGDEIFINSELIKEIAIPHDGELLVFKKTNPDRPDRFYQVLYEDAGMVFFKDRRATITDPVRNGIADRDGQIRHSNRYFISQGEGQIAKVKLKKKDVFSSFIDDEVYAMKEYAKKKGIKFSNEQDYVEVFEGVAAND